MLEHKIQQAFSHATPDVWDSIRLECEEQLKNEENTNESNIVISTKKEQTWIKNAIGLVASILLFVATAMGIGYYEANYVVASVITLGEYASINIVVNAQGEVLKVQVLNHEEYSIGTDLKGATIEEAIHEIVAMIDEYEYIAENSTLIIGVANENAEENYEMRKRIQSVLSVYLANRNVNVEVVNQEMAQDEQLREIVEQYHISFLRAKSIRDILNLTSMYTIEELIVCDSNLLNQINHNEIYHVPVMEHGVVVEKSEISSEDCMQNWKLVEIAYNHAMKLGTVIDKFDITYTMSYDYIKKMWILEVHLLEEMQEESTQRVKFTYKVNGENGEIEYYEAVIVPILIGIEKAQNIVFNHAYPDGNYSLIDFSIRETVKDGVYSYEIQFRTKQHKAYYEVNAQSGEVLNCILEKQ